MCQTFKSLNNSFKLSFNITNVTCKYSLKNNYTKATEGVGNGPYFFTVNMLY